MLVISFGSTVAAGRPAVRSAQSTRTVCFSAVTGTALLGAAQLPSYCVAAGIQRPALTIAGGLGMATAFNQRWVMSSAAVPTVKVRLLLPVGPAMLPCT